MTERPRSRLWLAAAALVLVAACAVPVVLLAAGWFFLSQPTAEGPAAPPMAPAEDPVVDAARSEAPSEGAAPGLPERGGVLRLPGGEPSTLDPALVRDVVSAEYMYEVFGGLVTLSPELEVIPDLATGWQVGGDGTVYTFTLRTDVVFHDGTPVLADDVAWSIERACDPATGSLVAETYLGDILGCSDKLAGRVASVAGLSVPDGDTIVLTIDAPKAYFLSKLTYPTSFVLDRRQVETDPGWQRAPNGTGPFRLAEMVPDELIVLERHAGYHGAPAHLDAVHYDLRPVVSMTLYENGELDATPVGLADIERAGDPLNPLSNELAEGPGDLGLTYVGMNTRRAPFDDAHVRRALNFALDKRRLTDVVLRGAVAPANWILPPGMPGHTEGASPFRYDPAAALAELEASRYGGPEGLPPITLHVSGQGRDPAIDAVVDLLGEALGIDIEVELAPWQLFQNEVAEGAYGLYVLGWSADYPDPQDFLDVLFHSASPLNHTGYASPEVDAWLEAARLERDVAARMALYARAESRILEDAPWLPLYTGVDRWLVAPIVRGFGLPPIVMPRLARVWLDES